jgi:hypothetical protein
LELPHWEFIYRLLARACLAPVTGVIGTFSLVLTLSGPSGPSLKVEVDRLVLGVRHIDLDPAPPPPRKPPGAAGGKKKGKGPPQWLRRFICTSRVTIRGVRLVLDIDKRCLDPSGGLGAFAAVGVGVGELRIAPREGGEATGLEVEGLFAFVEEQGATGG